MTPTTCWFISRVACQGLFSGYTFPRCVLSVCAILCIHIRYLHLCLVIFSEGNQNLSPGHCSSYLHTIYTSKLSSHSFPLTPACSDTKNEVDVRQPWLLHQLQSLSSSQTHFILHELVHWLAEEVYMADSLRFKPNHCLRHHLDLHSETTIGQGKITWALPSTCATYATSCARADQETHLCKRLQHPRRNYHKSRLELQSSRLLGSGLPTFSIQANA